MNAEYNEAITIHLIESFSAIVVNTCYKMCKVTLDIANSVYMYIGKDLLHEALTIFFMQRNE